MTPRIQKAINIFLDAINEGTLAKGNCSACAVGNLVANGMNAKITIEQQMNSIYVKADKKIDYWKFLFMTCEGEQLCPLENEFFLTPNKSELYTNAFYVISFTDFTLDELKKIEYAFETNTIISYTNYPELDPAVIRRDQIKGLEAVVKVMLEFDEQKDIVQEVFTEKANLIPV